MKNKFPIYIVSKGRYEIRLTSDSLSRMKVDHYIVVEEQEYVELKAHIEAWEDIIDLIEGME